MYTILSKSYNLIIEEVNEPKKPFRALVKAYNVNKVFYKIVKTSNQELRSLMRKKYGKDLYEKFLSFPTVKTFTQSFADDGDHQSHNTEIVISELETGYYII
ncbi:MAG: hypothetical protein WCH21_06225, partial [Bacteroidota bacterium]